MAEKKIGIKESRIKKNVIYADLKESKWLYNPVVFSLIAGDFTLLQQRILVKIVACFQDRIGLAIKKKKKDGVFGRVIDEELAKADNLTIAMPLSSFGVSSPHYQDIAAAAVDLGNLRIKYPEMREDGSSGYVVSSLFPKVFIPKMQGRNEGTLEITMDTKSLESLLDMQGGFVKHLFEVPFLAKRKRTPRLYIFLSRYRDCGHKNVRYSDLVEYLGLTDEYIKKDTEDKFNRFNTWSGVKKLIMEPVRKEMEDLAKKNLLDFWFEYEALGQRDKTRGEPSEIKFTIIKSEMGKERSRDDYRNRLIEDMTKKLVRWCPDIDKNELTNIIKSVKSDRLEEFSDYVYKDMRKQVEARQPDDVASYALKLMSNWGSMIIRNKTKIIQPDLFANVTDIKAEELTPELPDDRQGEYAEEWGRVVASLGDDVLPYVKGVAHRGSSNGFLWIEFPDQKSLDAFNALEQDKKTLPIYNHFMQAVRKVMGRSKGRVVVRSVAT